VAPVSGFVRMVLMVLLVWVFIVGYITQARIRIVAMVMT